MPNRKNGPKAGRRGAGPHGADMAPTRITKPERLLNLVSFLLSSRTAVPFSRIKGRVAGYDDDATPEALEKRFDRDKAELRALGVPIVYDAMDEYGHEGYRIPREQYFLPEIRLSVDEAAALAVVQRYAHSAADDPLSRALVSALRKVVVDSPLSGAAAASATEQHRLGVRTRKGPPELAANLELLTDAVLRRRAVKFRYYSIERDDVEDRQVEPYGLGWHRKNWYLVGKDRVRDAVRQYRVDRLRGRARLVAGKSFDVPSEFDVSEHVGRPAFVFDDAGVGEPVAIELHSDVAFLARDDLREGWTFEDLPGGGGVLRFDATSRAAVLRFVASHAGRARVLAPEPLQSEAREHFRSILARYDGEPTDVRGRAQRSARKGGKA